MKHFLSSIVFLVLLTGSIEQTYAAESSNPSIDQSSIETAKTLPIIQPLKGIYVKGFGTTEKNQLHEGLDIQGKVGDPVVATAPGTVEEISGKSGAIRVRIRHNKSLETSYSNLQSAKVKKGSKVARGDKIGTASNNPLYYQVLIETVPVDPLTYIKGH